MSRPLPNGIHEIKLPPNRYADYTMGLVGPESAFMIIVKSTNPIDLLIMDEQNFLDFENDRPYFHYGVRGEKSIRYPFRPPKQSSWRLVVGNPDTQREAVMTFSAHSSPLF